MLLSEEEIRKFHEISTRVRLDVIRMTHAAGSGHPGGSLSATDILVYLYYKEMKVFPKRPKHPDRDIFILSKGHACPALYSVLAYRGFFDPEELMTLRRLNSRLQGHPDMRLVPGIEMSTGSLGQGLSVSVGIALGLRLEERKNRVYVLMGDGEQQEGMVWEAATAAVHYKLDNICAILDFNGLQIDGKIEDVMDISPIADKYRTFGWHVQEINGHNFAEMRAAFYEARQTKGKPSIIIAHTIKGKGVSFMENVAHYHGVAPNDEEYDIAKKELLAELEKWQTKR